MSFIKKGCPMTFNIPPDQSHDDTYDCAESLCAWWNEDAQKCAVAVIAESQRKAAKTK